MAKQKETLNSSEETKTGSWKTCGQKQGLAKSYHGRTSKKRQKSFLRAHEPISKFLRTAMSVRSRKMTEQ